MAPVRARRSEADSDQALVERLAAGDLAALGELYDRHASGLRRFAARLVGPNDAEDLAHEAFLALARGAARYDGKRELRAYLFGITAMLARRRARSVARLLRTLLRARSEEPPRLPSPEDQVAGAETRARFERALGRLSLDKRTVLVMAEAEGMSGEAIAAALGIPVATVWTRLHYARADLRRLLGRGGA